MSSGQPLGRFKNPKRIFFRAAVSTLLGLSLMGCGEVSEEQRLIDRFKHLAALAEDKDTAKIMNGLSPGYQDFEGRDKAATEEMIQGYFESYRGIVLHVLGAQVADLGEEEATLDTDVMFSSGPAQAVRRLVRLGGECYRIKVRWVKEGGTWMAAFAEWRPVGFDDLFPESRDKLGKILSID